MKNRAARGVSVDNDKVPSSSKFHFSKGNYGNIVLAWHSVLIRKAQANFPDICVEARKAFGAMDVEIWNDNQRLNPEVRTCVGLDSESESGEENGPHDIDDEDHGNDNDEDNRNGDIDYHGNNGNNEDADDGNGSNGGIDTEKSGGGMEIEEVASGPSRRGRCSTKAGPSRK